MRTHAAPRIIDCFELPPGASAEETYRLLPNDPDPEYYRDRTDRNIGWITEQEQDILRKSVVGIAGCGGMGGLLASVFVRTGIGEVRIADCETFDRSNINRQYAATRSTVDGSKALETARLTRMVSDDSTLVVYPQGITERTVDQFCAGCDVILDEIELLAIDARILLHERARSIGVSLFNCNTVGFGTNLFLYTPASTTMEEMVGFGYEEAKRLREAANNGDEAAAEHIATAIMRAVIPEMPEYRPLDDETDRQMFYRRLRQEKRASIIATNPLFAGGFLADRVLLYLLRGSGSKRVIPDTPSMPAYLHIDAAYMSARIIDPWAPA